MTHPLMPVIICVKYGKNPSRIVCVVEWTPPDVPYLSSFITKSWLNGLEDIGQGQRSLHVTHHLMLMIICAKYGKNLSRTVGVTEQTCYVGQTDRRRDRWSETNISHPQQLCCAGREREIISLSTFLGTEDIGVHIVHISRVIITYTLE